MAECPTTANEMTSTEDLETSTESSDFVIKVDGVSYPVHQNILTSKSVYFQGMLAHDTKERQNGFVEMKEINSKTMKICIDFMYDRDIDVTMATAKTLLPASEFLQLTELSKRCVGVLEDNLYSGNCITVLKLARAYDRQQLAETALKIFRESFKNVNFEDFCKLDKENLIEHINDLGMEKAWDAIINWIKLDVENRSSDIVELVEILDWKIFPSSCFLLSVWSESLFTNSELCRNMVFKRLFFDAELLKNEINVENYFIIEKISSEFTFLTREMKDVLSEFSQMNLMQIASCEEFLSLSKEKILCLLSISEAGLCEEYTRWNVAQKWLGKHAKEKEDFTEVLKCIHFDQLPKDLIKTIIDTEPKISCLGDVVLSCLLNPLKVATCVAIFYPDGRIWAWNITGKTWKQLPDCPAKQSEIKMFSFRDKLCILADGKLFYLGKNETKWISRATLKHRLNPYFTVVSSDDRIYVVEKEKMSCYDPDTNTWDETLPGCGLEYELHAGCSGDRIYVRNNPHERTFLLSTGSWKKKITKNPIGANAAMASYDGKIFVVGINNSKNVSCYEDAECYSDGWKNISSTPVAINKQCHLFFVDERLFLLISGTLYQYIDVLNDNWVKLGSLPQYTCLGMPKNLDPVLVCSFKGNSTACVEK